MSDSAPDLPEHISRAQVASALRVLGVTDERVTQVIITGESIEFTYPVREEDCEPSDIDEALPPDRFLTRMVPIVN